MKFVDVRKSRDKPEGFPKGYENQGCFYMNKYVNTGKRVFSDVVYICMWYMKNDEKSLLGDENFRLGDEKWEVSLCVYICMSYTTNDKRWMLGNKNFGLGDEKWCVSVCVYILYVQLQEYS